MSTPIESGVPDVKETLRSPIICTPETLVGTMKALILGDKPLLFWDETDDRMNPIQGLMEELGSETDCLPYAIASLEDIERYAEDILVDENPMLILFRSFFTDGEFKRACKEILDGTINGTVPDKPFKILFITTKKFVDQYLDGNDVDKDTEYLLSKVVSVKQIKSEDASAHQLAAASGATQDLL